MEYGAIDLHLRHSEVRIVSETGAVLCERRIVTAAGAFRTLFEGRGPMRVLLESGTESEWVAQTIEGCGHEVIVADPNYLLMYAERNRRIKTDRRDVAALAEACRLGIYRRAHRVSREQRGQRRVLRVREHIVRIRTQAINLLRAQLRQEGYRLPGGRAETAVRRVHRLELPPALTTALQPLLDLLEHVHGTLTTADTDARARADADPVVRRLMTAPGIGPITALTFRATLDEVARFRDAGRATAYVGLVPSEDSSGERRHRHRITKRGPTTLRSLLVQAAWVVWRQRATGGALYAWVEQLAARRKRPVAIVALARRLTRILYAMWRDGTDYQPGAVRPRAV